ncbi:MAG TPA: tetratricopeptide repeat protein [Polyangiaceae bacterium]
MNKRLEMLEKLTSSGQAEAFAWYGLAMEYRKLGRVDEALATFRTLRSNDPEYIAMYLMAGQMLLESSRAADAREWLEQGITIAQKRGDFKALGELEDALSNC